MTADLNPTYRRQALTALRSTTFDVVVIGGGITGAGAALDAASRGLSVALIEAQDYAAGTSSKSSKLIHGGLRYLEMLDFKLVREALRERELLLTRLAPHLVKPVPFLWPLTHRVWERFYLGAGLVLYDTIGGARSVPRARHLTRTAALKHAPGLRRDAFVGAVQFYDAQEDDARMVVAVARTAAQHGAIVTTNVRADDLLLNDDGAVRGVRVTDVLNDTSFPIAARHVVSATGVWSHDILAMLGHRAPAATTTIRPSKGIHLVVPKNCIPSDTGLLLRTERSVLFVIPWGNHWLIGDTDDDWTFDRRHPAATKTNVDYLLSKVNSVLDRPLTNADIESVFTGLRPLVADPAATDTSKVSREHSIHSPVPGLTTIAGGKYTTYRVMARDLIDTAVARFPTPPPPSRTEHTPLVGAHRYSELWDERHEAAQRHNLSVDHVERLLNRYGDRVIEVYALIDDDATLAEPIAGAPDYLRVEALYAATHEGALHLDDVLARRTRIAIETRDRGCGAALTVAQLIGPTLGWNAEDLTQEVDHYVASTVAEWTAQQQATDEQANAARMRVPGLLDFYPNQTKTASAPHT